MAARSSLRRVLLGAAWLLGVPAALVALALLGLLVALSVRPLRAAVAQYGLDYVQRSFGYSVTIGSIDRLDPWAIELHQIRVSDPAHHELGQLSELSLRLQPLALMHGTLHVTRARVAHLHGRYDLEALLAQPSEPESPEEGPSTLVVIVDMLRVLDTRLETPWAGRKLTATIEVLEGGGVWGAHPRVGLSEAKLNVVADGDEILRLMAPRGKWSAAHGGQLALTGALAGAPLAMSAKFGPLEGAPSKPALGHTSETWPVQSVELTLSDFGHDALHRLGLDATFDLSQPLSLEVSAQSEGENVKAQARLRFPLARDARVQLEAKANLSSAEAELRVEPLTLSAISPGLPAMRVEGTLKATAKYAQKAIPLSLAWRGIQVDGRAIPNGQARAVLDLPWLRLESLSLTELGPRLSLRGAYNTESGAADADLKLDRLRLERLEPLRAQKLAGELSGHMRFSLNAQGKLGGQLNLKGAHLAAAGTQIEDLSLEATLAGNKVRPQGNLRLDLAGLGSGEIHFDTVHAAADLSPDTLLATIDGTGKQASLHSEVQGTRARDGELTVQATGRAHALERALTFELEDLRYGPQLMSVEQLSLRAGKQTVSVRGSLRKAGPLFADVTLHEIDLASWASLVGKPQLRGKLEGTATLSGTVQRPQGALRVELSQLSVMGEAEADASLQANVDLEHGKLAAALQLRSAADGLKVEATAGLTTLQGKRVELVEALKRGEATVSATGHVPASRLLLLGDERISALRGTIDLSVEGHGTMAEPHLALQVAAHLKLPEKPSAQAETLQANLRIEPESGALELELHDDQGKLVHVDARTVFAGGSLQAALARPEGFQPPPLELHVQLHERRLDTMQGVYGYLAGAYKVDLPVRVGAKLTLESDGQSLDGDAAVRLVVHGDKIDKSCVVGSSSALNLDARLTHGDVRLDLTSQGDAAGQARIEVTTHVDVAQLMAGQTDLLERVKVTLQAKQIELSKLPGLCALKSGKADLNLRASLFGKQPVELDSKIVIEQLRGQRGTAFGSELALHTHQDGHGLKVMLEGDLRVEGKPNGQLEASVPLAGDLTTIPEIAPDAAVRARVRFRELPLSGPLSAVNALGQVSGTASADLSLAGTLKDPRPAGFLELQEVGFTIASLAQPVRHLNARIELRERELSIVRLSTKDGEGEVKLSGGLKLNEAGTGKGRVHLNAERFPLRQEGIVVGELTLDTEVGAQLEELTDLVVDVDIHRGRLWLTGDQGRNVQQLDPNPDIVFEDAPPEVQADAHRDASSKPSLVLKSLTIKSHRDMWVMHTDFSVQVALDLRLDESEEVAVMRGDAQITRGELQILGKTFKIQKGTIHFTGDVPPDPDLSLKATYQPPSSQPLHVQVSGLASAPVLTFSGAATNMGEAVTLLSGVGKAKASNNSAQQDVSNFASTLTAGLLSVAARRKFGDWVPTLGVETNASGQVNGARAGFDASDMIPQFMRGFTRGAYVEGVVGGTSQNQGGSVGVGVRLDLSLPHDFVTSMGYGPGTRWSADLLWAP